MKQVKCVITDDEPTACEGLQRYVEKVDFLSLMGVCEDTMQLNTLLQTEQPDLLFLDIKTEPTSGSDTPVYHAATSKLCTCGPPPYAMTLPLYQLSPYSSYHADS